MGAPTVHWQYQWCGHMTGGEMFGPFDSSMMHSWQEANVFAQNPAKVRRCSAAGQPIPGEEWQPADQAVFMPPSSANPAAADTPGNGVEYDLDANGQVLAVAAPLVARDVATTARDQGALSKLWWELSRPRKRGKIAPVQRKQIYGESLSLLQQWMSARGVEDTLVQEPDQKNFQVYRFARNTLTPAQEGWDQAFHGTRWYALWLILTSGVMLASDNKEAGHDFWEPGVYCTPVLETARWYGIPHILFNDDIYHRVVIELRVDPAKRKRNRQRGGVQWVFPADATVIKSIWVQSNAPPDADERRFLHWDTELEALPPGKSMLPAIRNPSRQGAREDLSWYEEIKKKIKSESPKGVAASPQSCAPGSFKPLASPAQKLAAAGRVAAPPVLGSLGNVSQTSPLMQSPLNSCLSGASPEFQKLALAAMEKAQEQKRLAMASVGVTLPGTVGLQPGLQAQPAPGSLQSLLAGGAAPAPVQPGLVNPQMQAAPGSLQGLMAGSGLTRPAPAIAPGGAGAAKRQKFLGFASMMANIHAKRNEA